MFIGLCIHIDINTGFQFYGDMVIPDGYLFDPASHQRFIKFGEVSSLLCDIILQFIDPLYLLVSCGSVDGGLLASSLSLNISSAISSQASLLWAFWISSCWRSISFSSLTCRADATTMFLLAFTVGVDFTVVVRVELFVYVYPTLGFLDVDTVLFTLIVFVCHSIFSFRHLNRSGDNRHGCQCFS